MKAHRHLQIPDATPVDALPSAAIVDLLERGDLADWTPLLAVIREDPFGPFAARVAHLVDAFPAYGTSPLWRAWIERQRARAEGRTTNVPPCSLADLRKEHAWTQQHLATRLGMSQSDLSKLERRRDVRVSTLRAYLEALGGRLRLTYLHDDVRREVRVGPARRGPSR